MASLQRATAAARSKLDSTSSMSPDSDENLVLRECLDFREVDEERQSKYAPGAPTQHVRAATSRQQHGALTRVAPPTVRIERRVFQPSDASMRSSVASEDYLDVDVTRDARHPSTSSPPVFRTLPRNVRMTSATAPLPRRAVPPPPKTLEKQTSLTHAATPASRSPTLTSSTSRHHSDSEYHDYCEPPPPSDEPLYAAVAKYVALPSDRTDDPANASPCHANVVASNTDLNVSRDVTVCVTSGASASAFSRNIPAFATMPRSKRVDAPQRFVAAHSREQLYPELHATASLGRSYSERRAQPPLPPARRLPSWESRIYEVAKSGLRLANGSGDHHNNMSRSCVTVTDQLYSTRTAHVSVPVFTLLKGVTSCFFVIILPAAFAVFGDVPFMEF